MEWLLNNNIIIGLICGGLATYCLMKPKLVFAWRMARMEHDAGEAIFTELYRQFEQHDKQAAAQAILGIKKEIERGIQNYIQSKE